MDFSNYGFDPNQCHKVQLRVGEYSKEKCWEKCKKLTGGETKILLTNQENVPMEVKEQCLSVINKPLLTVKDLDKHHGDPLHIFQGTISHTNDETFLQLNDESLFSDDKEDDFFYMEAEACQNEFTIDAQKNAKLPEYQEKRKERNKVLKNMRAAMKSLEEAKSGLEDEAEDIQEFENNVREMEVRLEAANEDTSYKFDTRLYRGAAEIEQLIDKAESNDNSRMTKAAFLFRSAIRTYAGFYTAMHTSMELTGRRGILALEARNKIHIFVVNGGYSEETTKKVKKIMDTWLALSDELYPIVLFLNDQEKQDDEAIIKYVQHVAGFLNIWLTFFDYKNQIFLKLHIIFCGGIAFPRKFKMIGRSSSQAFESKHWELAHTKEICARIAQNKVRAQKMAERSQALFIEGLHESLNFLKQADDEGKNDPFCFSSFVHLL